MKEALGKEGGIHPTMLQCLKALVDLQGLYDEAGMFLTTSEFHKACNLAKRFFESYEELHHWALGKGRKILHVTFKFHSFHHLIRNSQFMNYTFHANYRAEHFVGQLSVLKIAAKYRALLHLQFSRPGFGHKDEGPADP